MRILPLAKTVARWVHNDVVHQAWHAPEQGTGVTGRKIRHAMDGLSAVPAAPVPQRRTEYVRKYVCARRKAVRLHALRPASRSNWRGSNGVLIPT